MVEQGRNYIVYGLGGILVFFLGTLQVASGPMPQQVPQQQDGGDTTQQDDTGLPYPIQDNSNNPLSPSKSHSLDLGYPESMERDVQLDSSLENFRIQRKMGDLDIGDSKEVSFDDYLEQQNERYESQYFQERAESQNFVQGSSIVPDIDLGDEVLDKILSGEFIDIRPQGSAELTFKGDVQRTENPAWNVRQQRTSQFKFDQKIQLNVTGTIGDRVKLGVNYDTESNFSFDNEVSLDYQGNEDEIVQKIELGNINMDVPGTLISGSQSLFGVKTKLKFGRLTMTSVFSQQRSEKKEITVQGGAQRQEFNVSADDYDANRHFFLGQYFRNNFNEAMANLPVIRSQVQIKNLEVWVTNRQGATENTRNIVGHMDLGSPEPYNGQQGGSIAESTNQEFPDNSSNTLYEILTSDPAFRSNTAVTEALRNLNQQDPNVPYTNGQDYVKIDNAKQLNRSEYTLHPQLGYISLNKSLKPDEVLAVSYEYTIRNENYQVGEFAKDVKPNSDDPNVLHLKLLKSYTTRPELPTFDLMMKNIYSIGGVQLQKDDFRLQVVYEDDESGGNLNYIPENNEPELNGEPLIRVLGLDQLNRQQQASPDGAFDYIPGLTIMESNGRIVFPLVEPFGNGLEEQFEDKELAQEYLYNSLYDSTQFIAEQDAEQNKYSIRGHFQSSQGKEININAINIPKNSIKVTAGGVELTENVDYTVDYTLGKVNIINESILNSGQVIKVSAESNTPFSVQQKRLIGTRLDYKISEDFNVGGTFMNLREKPITSKVNTGNEPISNTIWGVDGSYQTGSRYITQLVDKIPFIDTKEKSNISVSGEFAHLIPGHPDAVGSEGVSYLDDFEGSEIPIEMGIPQEWELASTPEKQPGLIPNASALNDLSSNYQRAKMAWYRIDDLFFRNNNLTPDHIKADQGMQSNHYMREVLETEVFPNKQLPSGVPATMRTFDIAYFPNERGPYNYNYQEIKENGELANPEKKWGGIMRSIDQIDFQSANVEYIEFWMLDPFIYNENQQGGNMYINLGNVSEDILKDGVKSFENGLPKDGNLDQDVTETAWGYAPITTPINFAFANDPDSRQFQDVGLDGLTDERERSFFDSAFLQRLANQYGTGSEAYQQAQADPSADNYHFYRGSDYDQQERNIIQRYKDYNGHHGNSPTPEQWGEDYPTTGGLEPDVEDINNDFTLNQLEEYFQYKVNITPSQLKVGQNYITDKRTANVKLENGNRESVTWYQFKIPVRSYDKKVGQVQGFKSIRFMRLFMNGFQDSVICRLADFNLVRGDWRRYLEDLSDPGEVIVGDPIDTTSFDIATVNIEENGDRDPINYVLPPGIEREVRYDRSELLQQNEQSLALRVNNLEDGDARAAFKNTTYDIRRYKNLEMYVHAEGSMDNRQMETGDLWLFLRLGTDFNQNYYEYAVPLKPTDEGATSAEAIWPSFNNIDLSLEQLVNAKIQRDRSNQALNEIFITPAKGSNGIIRVRGNPDLSDVQTFMIGVRNPKQDDNTYQDNGEPISSEVWVNELRVSNFDESGGWAANAKVETKLADFGNLTLSGSRKTIGFGGIEESLQERSREDKRGLDFKSSFNLGKFFPEKSGIKIPMYYNYSEQTARPQYNPLNEDVLLDKRLSQAESNGTRDSILQRTEDFTLRRSLNFTNVRKARTGGGDRHIYDIENFSFTYAFTERYQRNIELKYDKEKNYNGVISYNHKFENATTSPFRGVGGGKLLRPVRDFNFSYLPSSFTFRTELNRRIRKVLYRNNTNFDALISPNYEKNFTMKRVYDLNYNPFRSLRIRYHATADAIIDEPPGPNDEEAKDSLRKNLFSFGRPERFQQQINATYEVPISKFPMMNWVSLTTSYDGSYRWETAPPAANSFGNTINNSQKLQVNGQLNLTGLYNKVEFFKTINQDGSNVDRIKQNKLDEMLKEWRQAKEEGEATEEDKPTMADVEVNEGLIKAAETVSRGLMSVRNISFDYSKNRGTGLPGYKPEPQYFGMDMTERAPGWGFVFGSQQDIRRKAARQGWITQDTTLNNLSINTVQENVTAKALIEPVNNLRINLDFSRKKTKRREELFRYDAVRDEFRSFSPTESGTFSMSFMSLPTSFVGENDDGTSPTFEQFEDNRKTIANRLSESGVIDTATEFPKGYTPGSQQVIIPAFIAAYKDKNPNNVSLDLFPKVPAPNWRLNFSGPRELGFLEDYIKSVNFNHTYRSNYSINQYQTDLDYDPNSQVSDLDAGGSFVPKYEVSQITINEQLSPLVGIDITWLNNWSSRFEYKLERTLSMSLRNLQLTEMRSRAFLVGIGWRTQEFVLPFDVGGEQVVLKNDLNFRFDFQIRRTKNTVREVGRVEPQPTGGTDVIEIKPKIDYVINKNLNLNIFFNRTINRPITSNSFPRKRTEFGFRIRYTLGG